MNDTLPSAPSGSLVGGFTLASTSTNSAVGQNPLTRVAADAKGKRATADAGYEVWRVDFADGSVNHNDMPLQAHARAVRTGS